MPLNLADSCVNLCELSREESDVELVPGREETCVEGIPVYPSLHRSKPPVAFSGNPEFDIGSVPLKIIIQISSLTLPLSGLARTH